MTFVTSGPAAAKETASAAFTSLSKVRSWTVFDPEVIVRLELEAATDADVTIAGFTNGVWPTARKFLLSVPSTSPHFDLIREELRKCMQLALIAQARPERYSLTLITWQDPEDMFFVESKDRVIVRLDDGYLDCRLFLKD